MVLRDELADFLNKYLRVQDVADFGPMGLQVEGRQEVKKIITGVSANMLLFEKAVERKADLVLVHHGLLWDRDSRIIKGVYKKRLKYLLQHDLSLLAYHLVLDKHEEVGNNILAAQALKLQNCKPLGEIGIWGECHHADIGELKKNIQTIFRCELLVFPFGPDRIRYIGFCSGGAARELLVAVDLGLDVFITGEPAEPTMQIAREAGIHFIAAGHHATERLGICALGERIAQNFPVAVEFVDISNPV